MKKKYYISILIIFVLFGLSGLFFEVSVPKCNEGSKLIDGHYCMDLYSQATTVGLAKMEKDSAFINLTVPLSITGIGVWLALSVLFVDKSKQNH